MEVHYEDNQADHFLGNSLMADIRRRDDRYLIGGTLTAEQQTKGYAGTVSNGLRYTRRKDGRITSLSSVLSYGFTPSLTLTADTKERPQQIEADHFYTREEGSREWQLSSRSYVGTGVDFTSLLERLTLDYTEQTELRGADMRTRLTPYYRFESGKWQGRLTIPITWLYLYYREQVADREGHYSRLRPQISVSLSYRRVAGQTASIGVSTSESFGSFESFIRTPILASYRSSYIPGTGTPSLRRGIFVHASGQYRQPFIDFFTSLYLSGGRSETNRLTDVTITESSSTSEMLDRKSTSYNWSLRHTISKGIADINMLLRLETDYLGTANTLLRDGEPLDLQNHIIGTRLTAMNDFWSQRITSNLELGYSTALRGGDTTVLDLLPPRIETLTAHYRLSISPLDPLSITLDALYDHVRTVGGEGLRSDNLYLTAQAQYRIQRWEIDLDLMNLANRADYTSSTGSAADNHTYHYDLRPREVRLSLKYNY